MRVFASSVVFWVVWASVGGTEIPVPSTYTPPEWFSAASGEDFVVASSETTAVDPNYYVDLFWLRSRGGEFQGEPEHQGFTYFIDPTIIDPWKTESYRFSIFFWSRSDRPHFSGWHWYSYIDKFSPARSNSAEGVLLTSPTLTAAFTLERTSSSTDMFGSVTESEIATDYDIAPNGSFVAVERHSVVFSSNTPYQPSYSNHSVVLVDSNGLSTTYDNVMLPTTVPRYDPYSDTFHVLGLRWAGQMRIVKYGFSDTITSRSLYPSGGVLSDLDFQVDPEGRLHLIWNEAGVGLLYAVYEDDVLSSPVLLADPADYQFTFSLRTDGQGDLLLFNLSNDGHPTLWTRYHDTGVWEVVELPVAPEAYETVDGAINDSGGVSFLGYRATSPAIAQLWHSPHRGWSLNSTLFVSPNWTEIHSHDITGEGNVGLLVEKSDGSYSIVTNVSYGQATAAGGCWWMYP